MKNYWYYLFQKQIKVWNFKNYSPFRIVIEYMKFLEIFLAVFWNPDYHGLTFLCMKCHLFILYQAFASVLLCNSAHYISFMISVMFHQVDVKICRTVKNGHCMRYLCYSANELWEWHIKLKFKEKISLDFNNVKPWIDILQFV